ncbi:MAG: DUF1343 domain-containing protein [Elusimicrobia bacterium]|nr:DUF1343 domain-containing protein [Elusimicrobiota bacterium]
MHPHRAMLLASCLALAPLAHTRAEVRTGIDVLIETQFEKLKGKRVGLITNQTGRTKTGQSTLEAFAKAEGVTLAAVFAPEHGLEGVVEDRWISNGVLTLPGGRQIPLHSLYGSTQRPTPEMLAGLDALVFDIQDVGARFYTYAATMGMAMEAAAAANKEFYVLDRPNPITGRFVEGPLLADPMKHIIAYFPVPVRHGLTIGEIARLHVLLDKVNVNLHVIPLKGWNRGQWFDETGLPWTKPSPNMPDLESATLYPGVACLEFSNLSVGRGTPRPFLWVGAPWLNSKAVLKILRKAHLPGIWFTSADETPTKEPHRNQKSHGIAMRITDRDRLKPLHVFAHLAHALRQVHPQEFQPKWEQTIRMVGTDRFRQIYDAGASPEKLIELFNAGAEDFKKSRKLYLLY